MFAAGPSWSGPGWAGNWDVIWHYGLQHLRFTVAAVALGAAGAMVLTYLAHRHGRVYPPMLGVLNAVYAIPSITLFVILTPMFGVTSDVSLVVAMALYSLVILVRSFVEGLRAVPPDVTDAARAVGYRPLRQFVAVELPLALPSVVAGVRLATVSTISLISVGGLVGRGGLGRLFEDGNARHISNELWAGTLAVVVLALVADALVMLVGRLAAPWQRRQAR